MRVFGYTILKKETIGHGMGGGDECYVEEVTTNIETRIFESKKRRNDEREKSVKEYKKKYNGYFATTIESFVFESEIEK